MPAVEPDSSKEHFSVKIHRTPSPLALMSLLAESRTSTAHLHRSIISKPDHSTAVRCCRNAAGSELWKTQLGTSDLGSHVPWQKCLKISGLTLTHPTVAKGFLFVSNL